MRFHPLQLVVLFVVASSCGGCIERIAPVEVAAGVARLSIRQAGYLSNLVLKDTTCGFASPRVQRAALVQGQPGQQGAVTYRVTDCTITLTEPLAFAPDCLGAFGTLEGKVTVSGTQRILGTVTGSADTPVIPAGADALRIELDAKLDGLKLTKSDSKNAITMLSGALHFVIEPKLALHKALGVCAHPTLDLTFHEVRYENARVRVHQANGSSFEVDVPSSNLEAQAGRWGDQENSFSGTLRAWDTVVTLPVPGDPEGLDPSYTRDSYRDSLICEPTLAVPITYACPTLTEQLAHGAARLTVRQVGAIGSLIDADTRCGFSSQAVLAAASVRGTRGQEGSVTFTLPAPCTISFPTKTSLGKDCSGVEQFATGTLSIVGTKTLRGVLTGDQRQPVAPTIRDPAELVLTTTFQNFHLTSSSSTDALRVKDGTLQATVRPRVALDQRSSICSHTTSIATFPELKWSDASLEVTSSGFDFGIEVPSSTLTAQSGAGASSTNTLRGAMVVDGSPVTIPPAGADPVLDPSYTEASFVSSFSCAPGFQLATSDAMCSFDNVLATNIARLTVQTAGTVASLIQNDTSCGFSALGVKTSPASVTGENGQMGSITWNVSNCRLGLATGTLQLGTDCTGARSMLEGTASVSATRLVTGLRDSQYLIFNSIIPRARDAMTITLRDVALTNFASSTVAAGDTAPYARLIIHSGVLSGTVKPILGERRSTPGNFDVGTPVATFDSVELRNASVTLEVDGKSFDVVVPALTVSAQNGAFGGKTNHLEGSVTLSRVVPVSATALDPSFEPRAFDASYACTADLLATIPIPVP